MIISFCNQRGGCSKTSSTFNIGAVLKLQGKSVLFVDMDQQCSLSYMLSADTTSGSVLDAIKNPSLAQDYIQHKKEGDLLAGVQSLAVLDKILSGNNKDSLLKEAIRSISPDYDYILIDTAPSLGLSTVMSLVASDGVIIPATPDPFSAQGVKQLYTTIGTVQQYSNPDLKIMGILLSRYNDRTVIRRKLADMLSHLAESMKSKLYNTKIREATAVVEAATIKQSVITYAPKSKVTQDYIELVNELFNDSKGL